MALDSHVDGICSAFSQAADNAALEVIMGVASDREGKYKPAPLPGPPPGPPSASGAASGHAAVPQNAAEFLSALETSAPVSSSRGEDREVSDTINVYAVIV